jgi:hypothetical protein
MKTIVTTTINEPTEATLKYCEKKDWTFIIVGDSKTPHDSYRALEKKHSNVIYMSPDDQEKKYKELSDIIGWKSIERRNLGLIEAYNMGSEIIASVDDDNIPYDFWGENLVVGKEIEVDLYEPKLDVFEPLSVTNCKHLWHRGYPIDYLPEKNLVEYRGKTKRKVLVQADLWDGDPDIDAICRLTLKPIVKFDTENFYCSDKISPFNTQNTFFAREAFPAFTVFPEIGRMDDIWGAYVFQYFFPGSVVYGKASVYQKRNIQDLVKNLEGELIGLRSTLPLLKDLKNFKDYLPPRAQKFWEVYQKQFK